MPRPLCQITKFRASERVSETQMVAVQISSSVDLLGLVINQFSKLNIRKNQYRKVIYQV